ncbi:MAG TPA: serine hydrolase [Candidatus Saccharimonadia bacterium]|jgi:beta-lactamase class A|nr:serine hydrolase [Candidatus Saccharimonadia bacterium]
MFTNPKNQPRQVNLAAAAGPLRPSKGRRILVLILVIGAAVGAAKFLTHYQFTQFLAARVLSAQAPDHRLAKDSPLAQTLAGLVSAHPDLAVGVSIINLQNSTTLNVGNQTPFDAASVTKVLTAAAFLKQVEAGTQSLAHPMGAYTAGYELQEMVNISDNDAWNLIMDQVGYPELETYAKSLGLSTYDVETNTVTPADEARLLQLLYAGKLLNPADTQMLLSYMQNTNDEDLIPAALPVSATVYHKYGLLSGNLHDAAIIADAKNGCILVIFTKGADDSDDADRAALFRQITSAVTGTLL